MSFDQLHSLPPDEQIAILDGPALPPPPDVVPNLDSPPNLNNLALAVLIVSLLIATVAAVLRAYSRVFILRRVLLEDYTAFIGYTFVVVLVYGGFALLRGPGLFVHQWDIRVRDLSETLYAIHIGSIFYSVAIVALKISILLEWTRTFAPIGIHRTFHKTCHVLLWINALFYSAAIIAECLSCIPYDAIWDKTIPAMCIPKKTLDVSAATLNLASHLLILALPQSIIWKLNMSTRKKIGVALIFATGILTIIFSSFRLTAMAQYFVSTDTTYRIAWVALWSLLELALLVLVFSLPALPPIFQDNMLSNKLSPIFRSSAKLFSRPYKASRSSIMNVTNSKRMDNTPGYNRIDDVNIPLTNRITVGDPATPTEPIYHNGATSHNLAYDWKIIVTTQLEQSEEIHGKDELHPSSVRHAGRCS